MADKQNSYRLPSELEEATKYVYEKIKKLNADRKWIATRSRDLVKDTKAAGFTTAAVRTAMRMRAMDEKRREKHIADLRTAAALFGVHVGYLGEETVEKNELWKAAEKAQFLRTEARENRELKQELREIVRDYNITVRETKDPEEAEGLVIDFKALEMLANMSAMDPQDRADWFFRLDKAGVRVGAW